MAADTPNDMLNLLLVWLDMVAHELYELRFGNKTERALAFEVAITQLTTIGIDEAEAIKMFCFALYYNGVLMEDAKAFVEQTIDILNEDEV